MTSTYLPILHFNDVYRVTPQKLSPNKSETIDVTQFAALVDDIRDQWPSRSDGQKDGLLLFSGDVFAPSLESSVTRGSHMVPVLNQLGVDVTVTGNHDFDFGYPHLCKLIEDTHFPWLLSNIIDTTTSRIPEKLREYVVIERTGVRIGFIGLVEKDWIATVSSWPSNFVYKSMRDTGLELSKILRDPEGDHRCDFIIALTHARLPNDIQLAKELLALSPSAQKNHSIASEHGVDLILGGHDHMYFVGKGATTWDNYDLQEKVLGGEGDHGDILVVKSGTDFRDLSEFTLRLTSTPEGSVRKMVISEIKGKRHNIKPGFKSSENMARTLKDLLDSVSSSLKAPICRTEVMLDVRSYYIRVKESPIGNWFADISRHTYDAALCMKGCGGADGVLLCAGTFRGDSTYGPGFLTIGDILEILPFEDPIIAIEIDGETLWEALDNSLSAWPSQEGRFPAISGFRVSWDSRRQPGNRVLGIWQTFSNGIQENANNPAQHVEEPVTREANGKKYILVTREYMAQGHDGFTALTKGKVLIDDECGQMLSTIVRKYLLGSQFVNKVIRSKAQRAVSFLHGQTESSIVRLEHEAAARDNNNTPNVSTLWKRAASLAVKHARSKFHYQAHLKISETEHMTGVDAFDGAKARKGEICADVSVNGEGSTDLLAIHPVVDGRLKDEAEQ